MPKDLFAVGRHVDDHNVVSGIRFDLGGKSPLGRLDKDYDLIQTIKGFVKYFKNGWRKAIRKGNLKVMDNLSFVMEKPKLLCGDEELYYKYTSALLAQIQKKSPRTGRIFGRKK